MDDDGDLVKFGQHLRQTYDAARQAGAEHAPPDLAAADRALAAARGQSAPQRSAPAVPVSVASEHAETRTVLTVAAARSFCLLTAVRLRREDPLHPQLAKLAAMTAGLDRLVNAGQATLPVYLPPEGVRALSTDEVHKGLTAALAHLPGPQPITFDIDGARELLHSWSAKLDSTRGQLAQANVAALAALDQLQAAGVHSIAALVQPGDFSVARLRAAHAGITAARRSIELKTFEQNHATKERESEPAQTREPAPAPAPARQGTQAQRTHPSPARGASAPTPLPRRSQVNIHELTLGELKEKCQDIVASLDRAIIEHGRSLQSLGATSSTSGTKVTWELPRLRSEAELAQAAYDTVGGEWLATARAEADAALRDLRQLGESQDKAGKVVGALIGWRMRDIKTRATLANAHLAEVTTWLGRPEQSAAIASAVLGLRAQEERNQALASEQLEQLSTVTKARKAYAGLARELKGLTAADLRQSITLQGATVNELVHDEHARHQLSAFVEQRQRQRTFKREAGLDKERGLSA